MMHDEWGLQIFLPLLLGCLLWILGRTLFLKNQNDLSVSQGPSFWPSIFQTELNSVIPTLLALVQVHSVIHLFCQLLCTFSNEYHFWQQYLYTTTTSS